tara:strand:+ start:134 stop:550 length:417 start_codon:yes stop_codon:yes gene_type:complete
MQNRYEELDKTEQARIDNIVNATASGEHERFSDCYKLFYDGPPGPYRSNAPITPEQLDIPVIDEVTLSLFEDFYNADGTKRLEEWRSEVTLKTVTLDAVKSTAAVLLCSTKYWDGFGRVEVTFSVGQEATPSPSVPLA